MSVEILPITTATPSRPTARPQRSPPRNSNGELTCSHEDCKEAQPIFRRLCEYNKHMDKHERPYKCSNPACKRNPGFTYAGGLLRHQREVHNMHRTKDPFFCPHTSCNRSSGEGFSRRENLEEHLRRRHSGISIDDTNESTIGTESSGRRLERLPPNRKRCADTDPEDYGPDSVEDRLKARIAALQEENRRIQAELYRRDHMFAEVTRENQSLRARLPPQPPSLPRSETIYRPLPFT